MDNVAVGKKSWKWKIFSKKFFLIFLDIGVEKPTKEEVEEVLKELDENGDGKLSLDEFQVLIE